MDTPRSTPMREAELAARWAAGAWRGATLRTLSGATYRLIFEGRRNGGPGPDFRDAALEADDGTRVLGDVELHLRARDWLAHGHHTDRRYNDVILHIALDATSSFSPLADGRDVPIVSLSFTQAAISPPPGWPCANLSARIGAVALRTPLAVGRDRAFRDACSRLRRMSCRAPRPLPARATAGAPPIAFSGSRWPRRWAMDSIARRCARQGYGCSPANPLKLTTPLVGASACVWVDCWRSGIAGARQDHGSRYAPRFMAGSSGGHHGAARFRWRNLRLARSHHGGECRLPVRGGAGGSDR